MRHQRQWQSYTNVSEWVYNYNFIWRIHYSCSISCIHTAGHVHWGALCVPVFHHRGCRVAARLQKKMESTACLSPSSWGCLKNKCIYSERLFEKVVQRGRVKVTLYSVFSAKLFQISIQRESQIKQSCHHVHHCRYATPVVEMVSVKWRRKAYRAARKRKRHFVSLACKHIDEMNSVPKSLSDQGHSLKPELIKLYHSFRNLLLQRQGQIPCQCEQDCSLLSHGNEDLIRAFTWEMLCSCLNSAYCLTVA